MNMLNEINKGQSLFAKIILIFWFAFNIQIGQSTPLRSFSQCYSSLILVYSASSQMPAVTTSNFTYTFPSVFSRLPEMAIGNAGYSSRDRLLNQFWSITYSISGGYSGFIVHVRLQANTKTNIQYINYFAIDDFQINTNLFNIYYSEYVQSQLVNTSSLISTSSPRRNQDTFYYTPANSATFSTNSIVSCVTNTLWMRNSNEFGFNVTCQLFIQLNNSDNQFYSNSLKFVVTSFDENVLTKIGFYSIIVNTNLIQNTNYYQCYKGSYSIYTNQSRLNIFQLTLNESSNGITNISFHQVADAGIMTSFSSFGGNANLIISFGWQNLVSNSTKYIQLSNTMNLTFIQFNYLIFGVVDCIFWSVDQQACVTACANNQTSSPTSQLCRLCISPCLTCLSVPSQCRSCVSGYFLQNSNCLSCNLSNLTPDQKVLCNITTPVSPQNNAQQNQTSPPYWLAALSAVPVIMLIIIFYVRSKRIRATVAQKHQEQFKQYPSIQL